MSCTSTAACTAVGSTLTRTYAQQTLIEAWNGIAWQVVVSPNVEFLTPPVVGMAATPDGGGYWLVDSSGAVTAHGRRSSTGR